MALAVAASAGSRNKREASGGAVALRAREEVGAAGSELLRARRIWGSTVSTRRRWSGAVAPLDCRECVRAFLSKRRGRDEPPPTQCCPARKQYRSTLPGRPCCTPRPTPPQTSGTPRLRPSTDTDAKRYSADHQCEPEADDGRVEHFGRHRHALAHPHSCKTRHTPLPRRRRSASDRALIPALRATHFPSGATGGRLTSQPKVIIIVDRGA